MQDGITDGVKWLIDRGIADPDRICIYGASYGGYAALAAVTFTPDLYACGIDYAGISNIFTWMEGFPPFVPNEWWYERVGHPGKDAELLRAVSPFFHVDQIKVPMLIAQAPMTRKCGRKSRIRSWRCCRNAALKWITY